MYKNSHYEIKAKDKAIQYIKTLPSIYNDITFGELESQTKLPVNELRQIIENLVFTGQIMAEQVFTSVINPEIVQGSQFNVFLSYSTIDSDYFQINTIIITRTFDAISHYM